MATSVEDPAARTIVEDAGRGPDGIALDMEQGHIYWTGMGAPAEDDGFILRSDLDGENIVTIVPEGGTYTPKQLRIDDQNGKLYWSEPLATSFSMAIMAPRKGGDFLFAGGHSGKSLGLKLDATRPAVTKVWKGSRTTGLAPVSGTPFVEDGVAYGIDGDGVFRAMRIATGERLWGMPMWDDYAKLLNGTHADLCNIGPRGVAGSITAACFLREFVDHTPWVHIDIAGTAWGVKNIPYLNCNHATGFGVRLLSQWVLEETANVQAAGRS